MTTLNKLIKYMIMKKMSSKLHRNSLNFMSPNPLDVFAGLTLGHP